VRSIVVLLALLRDSHRSVTRCATPVLSVVLNPGAEWVLSGAWGHAVGGRVRPDVGAGVSNSGNENNGDLNRKFRSPWISMTCSDFHDRMASRWKLKRRRVAVYLRGAFACPSESLYGGRVSLVWLHIASRALLVVVGGLWRLVAPQRLPSQIVLLVQLRAHVVECFSLGLFFSTTFNFVLAMT
jgi:hypothetical protein